MDKIKEEKIIDPKFAERLAKLRTAKDVSARDMSLSIGQCEGYINNIENKKNYPSMAAFFYICEYLEISPCEFFDFENEDPGRLKELMGLLKKLDRSQLDNITEIVRGLVKNK